MLSRFNSWWIPIEDKSKFLRICKDKGICRWDEMSNKIDSIFKFRMHNEDAAILFPILRQESLWTRIKKYLNKLIY
jgi:hypothetical protein